MGTPGRSSRAPTSTQRPTPPRPSAPRTSARGAGARPPDQADGGLLLKGWPEPEREKKEQKGRGLPPTPKNIPPFFVRELKPASILQKKKKKKKKKNYSVFILFL